MKFVMKHGEHLLTPVHLKLPSGVEWEIEFRRCNNDGVWFKTRKRYRGRITKPEIEETDYEEEDDDNSVKILDGFQPCPRKAREKSPLPCPQPHKKMRICKQGLRLLQIRNEKAIAFESASPSFTVVMHPSYLQKGLLTVPVGFGKRHLMKQPAGNAILKVLDGGTWSVKFTYSKPKAQFQQGWRAFVRGNNSSDDYDLFINVDYGLFISDLEQSEALVLSEFSNIISEV
ncbi:hypothetical protein PRUPE_8G132600 [Prunus persica]|uniref:TF-B3 domain-containing protein n=1 Tax=Prunus persica TaxID=3760 RepID=A0A251MXD3_PRUPE|nr:hypothetical protein PRUPE_8G132600 [Prunus persica]